MSEERQRGVYTAYDEHPAVPGELRGTLMFHSETGTEGGHWAVQSNDSVHGADDLVDGKCPWGSMGRQGLCPVQEGSWHEHARYEGLYVLSDGDRLRVFDKENKTVKWDGTVKLAQHPLFTEAAFGFWIHADQVGEARETWAKMFFEELPCHLVKKRADA